MFKLRKAYQKKFVLRLHNSMRLVTILSKTIRRKPPNDIWHRHDYHSNLSFFIIQQSILLIYYLLSFINIISTYDGLYLRTPLRNESRMDTEHSVKLN